MNDAADGSGGGIYFTLHLCPRGWKTRWTRVLQMVLAAEYVQLSARRVTEVEAIQL